MLFSVKMVIVVIEQLFCLCYSSVIWYTAPCHWNYPQNNSIDCQLCYFTVGASFPHFDTGIIRKLSFLYSLLNLTHLWPLTRYRYAIQNYPK